MLCSSQAHCAIDERLWLATADISSKRCKQAAADRRCRDIFGTSGCSTSASATTLATAGATMSKAARTSTT